jgi:hypothetical protein
MPLGLCGWQLVCDLDRMLRAQMCALILQSIHSVPEISRINLKTNAIPAPPTGRDICRGRAHKRVKYRITNKAEHSDKPRHQIDRKRGRVISR